MSRRNPGLGANRAMVKYRSKLFLPNTVDLRYWKKSSRQRLKFYLFSPKMAEHDATETLFLVQISDPVDFLPHVL